MTTVNQGMSVEEIERVVAQRVANAIEAIAIYETKTNLAHKSISQTKLQEEKVADNASNKRKWEMKFHEHVDMIYGRMRASKPKTMQDAMEIATKLRNKKISTLVKCETENKKRLDNTSKNNQNKQQPNKRTNNSRTRGKTLAELTLQGMGRRNITSDLSRCILNATITMMVHVLPNATSATDLAI
nr:hypothetical protein [Tanacetum cinerariifolium]